MERTNGQPAESTKELNPEVAVRERYSAASQQAEASLCCPVTYAPDLLKQIPDEIIERDYGCGDPSPYVRPGDTVIDLGSGGGKLCYIAAQLVGKQGRIIGVDCNQDMLQLARKYQSEMAARLGFANVDFRCGLIQDLKLDLELLTEQLKSLPIDGVESVLAQRDLEEKLRTERPMIADDSVDCVISNCVLNLVRPQDRQSLFSELYRVVRRGGRVAISDIVCDEDLPESLRRDGRLWSGCISGAWREDLFLKEFEQAGFHGAHISSRQDEPWQTIKGYEFRSMTVVAYKGKEGPCLERKQALIYRGPFKRVEDDDGHVFHRGKRTAVCDKLYNLMQREPYVGHFIPVAPYTEIPLEDAKEYDCRGGKNRDPRETKGVNYDVTRIIEDDCCGNSDCC